MRAIARFKTLPAPIFVNHSAFFAPLQCLPLQQPDPLWILAHQLKPGGNALPKVFRRRRKPGRSRRDFAPQDLAKERFFISEIVIKHALIDVRRARNDIDPRAGEAMRRKLLQRRVQDPVPCHFRIATDLFWFAPWQGLHDAGNVARAK